MQSFHSGAERAAGQEGVVAKRLDSMYEPGSRSDAWRKMRLNQAQEFVIGGYTVGGKNFDAVIFGCYEARRAPVRRANAQRLHAVVSAATFSTVPRAGDRGGPIRKPVPACPSVGL